MDGISPIAERLIEAAEKHLPTANFDNVDKKGRVDWLASVLVEKVVQQKAPQLMDLHQRLKPLINGILKERLG